MKKLLFLATGLITLASCSENDFVGDEAVVKSQQEEGMITFSTSSQNITRADDHVGADAAEKLNKHFVVGGYKRNGSTMTLVFDNYNVQWTENSAAKTESNTSDWEYVGLQPNAIASIPHESGDKQTIKYWDYSQAQYDFAAYSVGTNTAVTTDPSTTGQIKVTAITKDNTYAGLTYSLKGAADDLAKCYISDMVTVEKAHYKEEVNLKFRSLATKIRVAFYETIPGYSVKDVNFYVDDNTTAINTDISSNTSATLFIPSGTIGFGSAGTYTVTFPTIGASNSEKADHNKAHVTFAANGDATDDEKKKAFGTLNYTTADRNEAGGNYYLGRSSNAATFAGTAPYYSTVLPNPNGAVLELRVDYTLVSIDGSGEEIKIHGAKAFVPAIYAQWLPNYAYTYIFKISDNTNGWTSTASETDSPGLYPITFDAVVENSEEHTQSTITTVAMPSITTYQKGHQYTDNEYVVKATDGDIYVQVIADGTLKNDLATKGQLYSLSAAKTEAEVMDALNIQASSTETAITGRNGLVLTKVNSDATITTIPGANGKDITVTAGTAAKFTPPAPTSSATYYYAYVYNATPTPEPANTVVYTAVQLTSASAPDDFTTSYYKQKSDGTFTLCEAGDYTQNNYYYQKYTNLNRVYGVKVIKVVDP